MSGVRDQSTAIWLSAGTAGINFVFTIVALFLVERLGRRKLIIGSLFGKKFEVFYKGCSSSKTLFSLLIFSFL